MARVRRPRWVTEGIDDKVLVADGVSDGRWLVLTRAGLTLTSEDGVVWHRGWTDVERGEWDAETHTLTVHWIGDRAPERLTTTQERPRDLPLTFRERVDASIVHVENEPARGGGTIRVIVRRSPDGDLFTQTLGVGPVRPGATLDDQIDAVETRARDAVGLR